MAVSFDLYGTLVTANRPAQPWTAVADALDAREVTVPVDWETAYRTSHVETGPLESLSLVDHAMAALASRGVDAREDVVHAAILEAFDGPVAVSHGAEAALRAASNAGPVGLLSNCSVPGLVERTLERAGLTGTFDAVVTSVECGWQKPHDRAFTCVAEALGTDLESLIHVGDDPRADGGGRTAGVTVLLTGETSLLEVAAMLEEGP